MSNLFVRDKLKVFYFLTLLGALNLWGADVDSVKKLMLAGKRKEALVQLETLIKKEKKANARVYLEKQVVLFSNQFFSADSFQHYQEAKGFSDFGNWDDCLKELSRLKGTPDSNNFLVLSQQFSCAKELDRTSILEAAVREMSIFSDLLEQAKLYEVELLIVKSSFAESLVLSEKIVPNKDDLERSILLKAKALSGLKRSAEAIVLLRDDQEKNLTHVQVIYELAKLYQEQEGNLWQARKMYSQFLNRRRHVGEKAGKEKKWIDLVQKAKEQLEIIDRRLGVQ